MALPLSSSSEMRAAVIDGLRARKTELDLLVAEACRRSWAEWASAISGYDLSASLDDLEKLSQGADCCYDRPSISLAYALWYQGRRTQDAVRALLDPLLQSESNVHVLDLGCGTAATVWALALIEGERRRLDAGWRPRHVTVTAVDSSPFMVGQARRMWGTLLASPLGSLVAPSFLVRFEVQSWTDLLVPGDVRPWVVASYLFDDSDGERVGEVAELCRVVAERNEASAVFLLGARGKRHLSNAAADTLQASGRWQAERPDLAERLWFGNMDQTAATRQGIYGEVGLQRDWRLRRNPQWDNASDPILRVLHSVQPRQAVFFPGRTAVLPALDARQDAAAKHEERLSAIIGSAGSGKSRVLVERVVRTLGSSRRERTRILISTFNKMMVVQLADWLKEALAASSLGDFSRDGGEADIRFRDQANPEAGEIRLVNWDKAPTRFFGVPASGDGGSWPHAIEYRLKELVAAGFGEAVERYQEVLEAAFLQAELHRVIYGLRAYDRQAYLDVPRAGRRARLSIGAREIAWQVLMEPGRPASFTHARIAAHRKMANGSAALEKFTHVFLDECQDFAPADFDLVLALVADPRRIVVCGDETQAMRLGASYRRPGSLGGARWKEHRLAGSYRLPMRICEAVQPLAELVRHRREGLRDARGDDALDGDDIVLPKAVRTAVLGVRPIVVAGVDAKLKSQLREIFGLYGDLFDGRPEGQRVVTAAEVDVGLARALEGVLPARVRLEKASMNQIKGLERPCVVWSTGARIATDESVAEWIYTILTRATSLVVIALSPSTPENVRSVVASLRADRLLFWTSEAERAFEALMAGGEADVPTIQSAALQRGDPLDLARSCKGSIRVLR